jgi:hypothetical protein
MQAEVCDKIAIIDREDHNLGTPAELKKVIGGMSSI